MLTRVYIAVLLDPISSEFLCNSSHWFQGDGQYWFNLQYKNFAMKMLNNRKEKYFDRLMQYLCFWPQAEGAEKMRLLSQAVNQIFFLVS